MKGASPHEKRTVMKKLLVALLPITLLCTFFSSCVLHPIEPPPSTPQLVEAPSVEITAPRTEPVPKKVPDPLLREWMKGAGLPKPSFTLAHPGQEEPVDYTQYGTFHGVSTDGYRYEITDADGLSKAVGSGIHPNEDGVLDEPGYERLQRKGKLDVSHWDALGLADPEASFYVWAQAREEPGVKAYFTATALEKAGLISQAIKAHYSVVVNFPRSAAWAKDGSFVWYVAPVSLASIERLCQAYPSLGIWLEGADIQIQNGNDTDLDNDIITVNPGRFVRRSYEDRVAALPDLSQLPVVEQRGTGQVHAVKFSNGHWQLRVEGQPFMVRGVTYGPTEIGYGPNNDSSFGHRWMFTDKNGNGKSDAAYDAWVDTNGNGLQDPDEPAIGDFQLLKDMGCNAIRFFVPTAGTSYDPSMVNKPLLRDLYETYGIRIIAGDFLGAYTVGSGASWEKGTDYGNAEQRAKMKEVVRQKVMDLKDEPFLLMWLLGNENNMNADHSGVNATRTNASKKQREYAQFLNEVAQMIHELDPHHPVAIGNLGAGMAKVYSQHAPEIDIFGINAYMGSHGFGGLWREARATFDRPVLLLEYGCDAYAEGTGPDEASQAAYHRGALSDIILNQAGGELAGNSIGGVIFEYLDEWWKSGDSPSTQATHSQWDGPTPDGKVHEEWFGIAGQGSGQNSPFERNLREAYFMYKSTWNP